MLKIGLFSKLSRVSIRMLRYYDEMGLLRPAYIAPDSDYRYYREDQLQTVGWITALRDMGFSLADVRRMSQLGRDAEALAPFFAARRRELQAETAKTAQQLLLLDTAEKRLGKEDFMQYNITIKTIPARYAACVHTVIPRYQDEGQVWQTLCAETDHMHLVPDDPCYCAVTFLDGEFKETDVELEAWKTVKGTYPDTPHVKFRTLPAVTVASCIFRGPYSGIGEVYARSPPGSKRTATNTTAPCSTSTTSAPTRPRTPKPSSPKPATRYGRSKRPPVQKTPPQKVQPDKFRLHLLFAANIQRQLLTDPVPGSVFSLAGEKTELLETSCGCRSAEDDPSGALHQCSLQ